MNDLFQNQRTSNVTGDLSSNAFKEPRVQAPHLLGSLYQWSQQAPQDIAHRWKEVGKVGESECSRTSAQLAEDVLSLAKYFQKIGIHKGQVGCLFAYNSSDWVVTDLALMLSGCASAGIYLNASTGQFEYILRHTDAVLLFADRWEDLARICGGKDPASVFPNLKKVILRNTAGLDQASETFVSLEFALQEGQSSSARRMQDFLNEIDPQAMATLIYTSGTTGNPKGVALSHANLWFAANSYSSTWEPPQQGRLFSFLPLSHIAERMSTLGLGLTLRYCVHFSSSPMSIAGELKEVQPTILLCVPRLWEKLKEGVESKLDRAPERKQKLVAWAMKLSKTYWKNRLSGKSNSPWFWFQYQFADKKILQKVREQLGLSKALRTASGAAALNDATYEWYLSIGVHLIEAYALSESSGTLSCGLGDEDTSHTVGKAYPGVELRLAEDGEIETRGPHVFMGYYKDPAATAQMLHNGWLKTGDLGGYSAKGFLKIVGRKREIIKTSEGKMISPAMIEAKIQGLREVDQAVVFGSERPYLIALISLSPDQISSDDLKARIQEQIKVINQDLASHERIKRFEVIQTGFSIEAEEVTATLKIRRHIIEKKYSSIIQGLYS